MYITDKSSSAEVAAFFGPAKEWTIDPNSWDDTLKPWRKATVWANNSDFTDLGRVADAMGISGAIDRIAPSGVACPMEDTWKALARELSKEITVGEWREGYIERPHVYSP